MGIQAVLIPGDGVGPEITDAALRVLDALDDPFDWLVMEAGQKAAERHGDALPAATLSALKSTRLGLKGPLGTPSGGGYRSATVRMREEFELFANVRPSQSFVPGFKEGVDLVLVRENLQGLYASVEGYIPVGGDPHAVAFATAYNTKEEMRRIIRYGVELAALRNGKKMVTVVHKSNILKKLSGILVEAANELAFENPQITILHEIADAFGANLVHKPHVYDVIVTTNLFGDLFSDIAARIVGSLGTAAGANYGPDAAIFEAVHGTADDIAGQGVANPTSILLSTAMMLRHVGKHLKADRLERAVKQAIMEGDSTREIGGSLDTRQFVDAVIRRLG